MTFLCANDAFESRMAMGLTSVRWLGVLLRSSVDFRAPGRRLRHAPAFSFGISGGRPTYRTCAPAESDEGKGREWEDRAKRLAGSTWVVKNL